MLPRLIFLILLCCLCQGWPCGDKEVEEGSGKVCDCSGEKITENDYNKQGMNKKGCCPVTGPELGHCEVTREGNVRCTNSHVCYKHELGLLFLICFYLYIIFIIVIIIIIIIITLRPKLLKLRWEQGEDWDKLWCWARCHSRWRLSSNDGYTEFTRRDRNATNLFINSVISFRSELYNDM